MIAPPDSPRRSIVVSAMGMAQILAWGSSYYLTAVLAKPVAEETGWSLEGVVGAFSLGLLVSGLVSPLVGRLIDQRGGRPVLAGSAVLLAAGLLVLAAAPSLAGYVVGWAVLGAAMGAGLYDPAFAALGRMYGEQARSAITHVTLFGGFASTVCWPLSALLVESLGWRGACLAYAGIALLVILPLYCFGLPREARHSPPPEGRQATGGKAPPGRLFALLVFASVMTLASVITTVVSVHLITLLQARGLDLAAAVALGTLFGPAQVGARILEAAFGQRHHPLWTLVASTIGVAAGLAMLVGDPAVIALGLVVYGAGSGIRSIARGTVPLALFGREGYAVLIGRLAMPILVAQAASPAIGAVLMQHFGPTGTIAALAGAAAVNIALTLSLLPAARRPMVK